MTLDFVAKRYGKLPSEVLESGTSIDIFCADFAVKYEVYCNKKAQDGQNNGHGKSTEELQAMVQRVKQRGSKSNKK